MWSKRQAGLLARFASILLTLGCPKAVGMGASTSRRGRGRRRAKFVFGERGELFTEDGRPWSRDSEESGFVALGGLPPKGYYKDRRKTATELPYHDGQVTQSTANTPRPHPQGQSRGSLHLLGLGKW